jgi:hypothetical protein
VPIRSSFIIPSAIDCPSAIDRQSSAAGLTEGRSNALNTTWLTITRCLPRPSRACRIRQPKHATPFTSGRARRFSANCAISIRRCRRRRSSAKRKPWKWRLPGLKRKLHCGQVPEAARPWPNRISRALGQRVGVRPVHPRRMSQAQRHCLNPIRRTQIRSAPRHPRRFLFQPRKRRRLRDPSKFDANRGRPPRTRAPNRVARRGPARLRRRGPRRSPLPRRKSLNPRH